MKLLFITQKVDKNDGVLGAYHHWIEKIAEKVDKISVICLYQGETHMPPNVNVYSLGKETADLHGIGRGFTRIKYALRFYKYIFSLRNEYDAVLVHMTPIYILLGGLFWKLSGKRIFLWYNHPMGNLTAKIAIFFSNKVFCTSDYSFSAKYKKASIMPVGVDTDLFRYMPDVKKKGRVLFLGRISPVKKIDVLFKAIKILDLQGTDLEFFIVGSPISAGDRLYYENLKKQNEDLIKKGRIVFQPSIPNYKTPEAYISSDVFINLTPTGSFDKSILEAMACGTLVLVSNKILEDVFDDELKEMCVFKENNSEDLAYKIVNLYFAPDGFKKDLRKRLRVIVEKKHGLDRLVNVLLEQLS